MERVTVIRVKERKDIDSNAKEMTLWGQRFATLLRKLPATVGEVIRIGQWLHSAEGRDFFTQCTRIVQGELGSHSKINRVTQSAATVLFAARKVSDMEFEKNNYKRQFYF